HTLEHPTIRVETASVCLIDPNRTFASEEDRARALAQDGSAHAPGKRLYWRFQPHQPPLLIGIAEEPLHFLCTDDQTVIQFIIFHQIFCHANRERTDGPVADQGVGRSGNAEDGSQMTRRRVEYCLRKKQRTGRLCPCFYDVAIEPLRVNPPT